MPQDDDKWMRQALAEAQKARHRGEVPVGAVLVAGGRILARGHNQPVARHDPTAHAEIRAIRQAALKQKNYRLPGCDLYVTLEPCAMCLGAIIQARIGRLVYGALDPKSGAVGSVMKFPFGRLNHRPEIRGGVLADECGRMLREFFTSRRRE